MRNKSLKFVLANFAGGFILGAQMTGFKAFILSSVFALNLCAASPAPSPVAAIYLGEWQGTDPALAHQIAADVHAAGYATKFIGPDVLTNSPGLLSLQLDLLVLPQARALPVASMDVVGDYLRGGGRLMAMGLPAWSSATFSYKGHWLSKLDYERALERLIPDHSVIDFAAADLLQWKRGGNGVDRAAKTEVVHDGQRSALHVTVEDLTGWNVLLTPELPNPFPAGRTLTCFRARGTANTRQMSVEWQEKDGSRWIAVIDLGLDWKNYALPPEAFHFWESVRGRGAPGDRLDVGNAARLSFGLARSHEGLPGPHHEYWMGNIGTVSSPFGDVPPPDPNGAPHLDTLAPVWKFYSMHGPLKLSTPEGIALLSKSRFKAADGGDLLQSMQPRPQGIGFNQERPWRWQPLIEAHSTQGDYRGAAGTLLLHFEDEYRGGIWACFTPQDSKFYQQKSVRHLIAETAATMRRGVFLQEGGAENFTAFEGQRFSLGARVINMSQAGQTNLEVRLTVKPKYGGAVLFSRDWKFNMDAETTKTEHAKWEPSHWPNGGMIVMTELLQREKVIDRLEHELNVWRPKAKPEFVQELDGGFIWRGKPWKINGVNYMPSSGIGEPGGDYFESWGGKGGYDPEIIQRDLDHIKNIGFNAVSIFAYHHNLASQHLLDFLRRCDALGLHVNQSLRPGTPMDFEWDKMKDLIEYYHLAQNDTIFSYDLAWEAEHHNEQHYYGKDWADWVQKHYGSVTNAEAAWGFQVEEPLTVPPLHELAKDGPWRRMIADYRALLDRELDEKYGEARRLIRSIDPNHAVSFRMNEAGDPTFDSEQRLPYDFYGLRKAVDIWEPEGYGRIGDWEHVRQGRFDIDYARLCDPAKPFIWAEMGYTVWDETDEISSPEKLDFQATFFRDFYRMMKEAGCDGYFCWWYPGGFRANEKSDYGIINPDGTDRPVTRVIREEGPGFLRAAKHGPGNYFISIDRDKDARGLYGIYQSVKQDYWQSISDGKIPALRWTKEPGGE